MSLRALCLVLALAGLTAGEPLLCRGFDAETAVNAVSSISGTLVRFAPDIDALRRSPVWLSVPANDLRGMRQALAHALDCWWASGDHIILTRDRRLPAQRVVVRTHPPLPMPTPDIEPLVHRIMDPWLAGDGGLGVEPLSGTWTATTSPAGQARFEALLGALGNPNPYAPHLLPIVVGGDPPACARAVAGQTLGDWTLDLARLTGMAVALGPEVDAASRSPTGSVASLTAAIAAISANGLHADVRDGCLCIGVAEPRVRQHPAERVAQAILPASHLCRDADDLAMLAARLAGRVRPTDWDQPGWCIAPLPWRRDLLVAGDPSAIHAVMAALEDADRRGLETWLQ